MTSLILIHRHNITWKTLAIHCMICNLHVIVVKQYNDYDIYIYSPILHLVYLHDIQLCKIVYNYVKLYISEVYNV